MLAFRRELDHGPLVEISDFDTLGYAAAPIEELAHACTGFAKLLAKLVIGNLEAAHGRPALFGITRGGDTQFLFELRDISTSRTDRDGLPFGRATVGKASAEAGGPAASVPSPPAGND